MHKNRMQNVRKLSPISMSSSRAHTLDATMQSDDDDDICPVCESECTCHRQQLMPTPDRVTSNQATESSPHNLISISQPKKRGRPPKALVQARIAAARAAAEALGNTEPRPQRKALAPSFVPTPIAARGSTHLQTSNRKKLTIAATKVKSTTTNLKIKAKKPPLRLIQTSSASSDSDSADDSTLDGPFPTFVSAASSSSSSSENDTDSDSPLSCNFDSEDEDVEREEERLIMSEEERKARVRRELLRDTEGERGPQKQRIHHQWESKPKKKSACSDVGGTLENTTDSGDDDDDEDDEETEDDAEPDQLKEECRVGEMNDSSTSDDDDTDANLFFANLSDSSADEDSAIEADRSSAENSPDDPCDLDAFSFADGAGVGLSGHADRGINLLVTEDWSGQLVLGNGHRVGHALLDMDFERNAAKHRHHPERRGRSRGPSRSISSDVDVSGSGSDNETQDAEDEDLFMDSDDGNTTDDDCIDHQGPIRFPTPPSTSVDPMSTVSPSVAAKRPKGYSMTTRLSLRRSQEVTSDLASTANGSPLESPNPSDILSGSSRNSFHCPTDFSPHNHSMTSLAVGHSLRRPLMGSFYVPAPPITIPNVHTSTLVTQSTSAVLANPVSDDKKVDITTNGAVSTPLRYTPTPKMCAVIDSTTINIPSPFPKLKRLRRKLSGIGSPGSWSQSRKRSASRSDIIPYFSKRRRQSSLPGSVRSPLSFEEDAFSSPELPPEPIDLDDVLDSSFLDDDSVSTSASSVDHCQLNLHRWDHVPMGTFRHTRTATSSGMGGFVTAEEQGLSFTQRSFKFGVRAAPDGFSYGSTAGAVMRKTPYPLPALASTALAAPFQTDSHWSTEPRTPGKRKRENGTTRSVTPSPGLNPVQDTREKTPTPGQPGPSTNGQSPINGKTKYHLRRKK